MVDLFLCTKLSLSCCTYNVDSLVAELLFDVELDVAISLFVLGAQNGRLSVAALFQSENILQRWNIVRPWNAIYKNDSLYLKAVFADLNCGGLVQFEWQVESDLWPVDESLSILPIGLLEISDFILPLEIRFWQLCKPFRLQHWSVSKCQKTALVLPWTLTNSLKFCSLSWTFSNTPSVTGGKSAGAGLAFTATRPSNTITAQKRDIFATDRSELHRKTSMLQLS